MPRSGVSPLPRHHFRRRPLACRVALEFLDLLDETLPHIGHRAHQFLARLQCLKLRHPAIREIRSKGLMFGIQLSQPARPFVAAALQRGLLLNDTQESVLRLLPPYILGEPEMDEAVRILDDVLRAA